MGLSKRDFYAFLGTTIHLEGTRTIEGLAALAIFFVVKPEIP